jgi:hypothetical protein
VELLGLVTLFLKETYIKVGMAEDFSRAVSVKNNLKHGDILSSLLFNVASESASGSSKKIRRE